MATSCLDWLLHWFAVEPNNVTLNGRTYRLTLLGEGGFSFVFAAEEVATRKTYAIKRITCQDEFTVKEALREAELYRLMVHPNIITLEDSCVLESPRTEGAKDVWMVLPLYRRGTAQDVINTGRLYPFTEQELLHIAKGLCLAVQQLHHFITPGSSTETPLAHLDIKPGNILLTYDSEAILMDFGSVAKARVLVTSRAQAVAIMDSAAEHCTMPYRAPELFDVLSECKLDERVDVWSIGCTIYAIAYGESPFERQSRGGSLPLAIANGKFTFPASDPYTDRVRDIIRFCLCVDMNQRPFIDEVLEKFAPDD